MDFRSGPRVSLKSRLNVHERPPAGSLHPSPARIGPKSAQRATTVEAANATPRRQRAHVTSKAESARRQRQRRLTTLGGQEQAPTERRP